MLTFWETQPPLYDHVNVCLAQVCATIANSNRGKGQNPIKLDKFLVEYTRKKLPSREAVAEKIKRILG